MSKRILGIPIVFTLAAGYGLAIGESSRSIRGVPLHWWLIAQAFAIQIVAFIPAAIFNTEKFYDLTGSLTFLSLMAVAIFSNDDPNLHQYIAALMIVIWAGRLGSFLFLRVLKVGEDSRFREIKKSKIRFFVVWLLQGLWAIIPIGPIIVVLTQSSASRSLGGLENIGVLVWMLGLIV